VPGWLLRNSIRALSGGVLGRFDPLPTLAAQDAHETPHSVLLPARGFHDLGQGAPFARFISAITSAFLLSTTWSCPICAMEVIMPERNAAVVPLRNMVGY
jgi:hypothetical protein